MSRTKVFSRAGAVITAVAVAAVFMVVGGCGGGDDNPGNGGGGGDGGGGGGGGSATLTDSRDGKKYRTVKIGSQTWMAENLNYQIGNSWCYENDASNCAKYGRLYDWSTAMNGASSSSATPSGVQGICPSGWHVPSRAEWTALVDYAGSSAGRKLKSKAPNWNGTDDFGFSALPGGYRYTDGSFINVGNNGYWWSATERSGSEYVYSLNVYSGFEDVYEDFNGKSHGFSVLCVQN